MDRTPEDGLAAAQRFLEYLATGAALSAPLDDEPLTPEDIEAIARARKDLAAGRVVSHEEILREFGMR
ncbi:MAG TPA: hypothetical protein VG297_09000 [Bryobacteraceae bacterium]|nr:hypothetical protein [Bryobacteraceae bacterium]